MSIHHTISAHVTSNEAVTKALSMVEIITYATFAA